MTAKHTPKQVDCICNKSTVRVEKLTAGPYIVTCWGCGKRTGYQAKRNLAIKEWNETVAAPEMLAACKDIVFAFTKTKSKLTKDLAIEATEAAIRKARGE